jgi:hypothetical protein
MVIDIQVIPHKLQRYPTAGDWYLDPASGKLMVKVSDTGDWRADALIAVHELVEALLCRAAGVEQHAVDAFDMAYKGDGEPGDQPDAPYHEQHKAATAVEKFMCTCFFPELTSEAAWESYEKLVAKL